MGTDHEFEQNNGVWAEFRALNIAGKQNKTFYEQDQKIQPWHWPTFYGALYQEPRKTNWCLSEVTVEKE